MEACAGQTRASTHADRTTRAGWGEGRMGEGRKSEVRMGEDERVAWLGIYAGHARCTAAAHLKDLTDARGPGPPCDIPARARTLQPEIHLG